MTPVRGLNESYHHLQLTIKKFDIIEKALKSIETMPELSKAGVLFNSILSQLSVMKESIQTHIDSENEMRVEMNENKEEQLEEHNYIIEFYDNKIKNQEKKIYDLEFLNEKLREEGGENSRELISLENQLVGLKQEIEVFQNMEKSREFESIEMLMKEVNGLIEELKHRDFTIQGLTEEIRASKEEASKGFREDHLVMSERILEVNKIIDSTQAEYMKLVSELETDNEQIRRESLEMVAKMVVYEARIQELQQKINGKNKEILDLTSTIKRHSKEIESYQNQQVRSENSKSEAMREKENECLEIQNELLKTEQTLSNLHNRLQSKNQESLLLQKQNCKLHDLLSQKEGEMIDNQRIINTINSKYQQQKKEKELLEGELEEMGYQTKQLADRLDLASKFKAELEKQRQQKTILFKQLNEKLTHYDTIFTQVKSTQLEKQEEFKKYIGVVKKEYQEVIAQLIMKLRQLESTSHQLQESISAQNNRISVQAEELNAEKMRNVQLKVRVEEQDTHQNKHQEVQSSMIVLAQENSRLKRQCRELEENQGESVKEKQRIADLEHIIESLKRKQSKTEEKLLHLNSQYQRRLKETESKLIKFNQIVAQKQLQVVELNTKNKSLTQDLFSSRRSSALEKTRLETRLTELEKVLKDRKSFEAKVNNLVF